MATKTERRLEMNHFKWVIPVILFSFITSCSPTQLDMLDERSDEYYEERKRRDDDRRAVLNFSRIRRSGRLCKDEGKNHECYDWCKEIYRTLGDKKDCVEELTVSQIEKIFELYELLEDPNASDLIKVEPEDFDVYLNISIRSLEDLIDRWNERESKEFLYWLLNNKNLAKIFEKEDKDHDTFTALLQNIKSFNYNEIHKPFIAKIENGRLMEVAIDSGNEKTMEWFIDYIEDKNEACRDETVSKDCFAVYCKIGEGLDNDHVEKWLDEFNEFESYIKIIIEDGVNAVNPTTASGKAVNSGTGWTYGRGNGQYRDIKDITSDWVKDLCGGLI